MSTTIATEPVRLTDAAALEVLDWMRAGAGLRGVDSDVAACEAVSRFITTRRVEQLELEREVEYLRRELSLQRVDGASYLVPAAPVARPSLTH